MSSEGSVTSTGSRIRQFGLYRTIDARTNEFLKSSRKRQIRQGCACAAISTAITVTVVISVILVYEYSINTESNENKKFLLRPKWLGLINESDPTKMDSKFTKKINFHRTTLKLLPVFLKALNKNRYLEKIIEDYASSSTPHEKTDETDTNFKRNIFFDTKNWIKLPASKMYTLEYKTTPLIYMKPSSQRLDYLNRVRKIRNYERMLNYFDKMINDKVTYSKPYQEQEHKIKPYLDSTANPIRINLTGKNRNKTKKIIKYKSLNSASTKVHKTVTKKNVTVTKIPLKLLSKLAKNVQVKNNNKKNVICKCPNNMGPILNRLIFSLQELVPHIANNKMEKGGCGSEKEQKTHKQQTTKQSAQVITSPRIVNNDCGLERKLKINKPRKQSTPVISKPQIIGPFTKTMNIITKSTPIISTTSMTSVIQPVQNKHKIKYSKDTTFTPSKLLNKYKSETTSLQKDILCPKNTKSTYSNRNTIIFNSKNPVTTNMLHATDQNIYAGNYIFTTIPSSKAENLNINNSLETRTFSPIREQSSDIEESTLKKLTSSVESITYEDHEKKNLNKNTISYNFNQLTTPFEIISNNIQLTTELIKPLQFNDPFMAGSTDAENLLNSVAIMTKIKRPILPTFKDEEYDDYILSQSKISSDSKNINLQRLSPIKNEAIPHNFETNKLKIIMRKGGLKSKPLNKYPVIKHKDVDLRTLKNKNNIVFTQNPSDEEAEVPKSTNNENNTLIRKSKFTNMLNSSGPEREVKSSPSTTSTVQNNSDNGADEEFQEWIKQPENIEPMAYNKSSINFNDDEKRATVQHSEEKVKYGSVFMNSMLPSIRPVYLEVRRNNEWKPEEHIDYDMNLASNIFDLPDV